MSKDYITRDEIHAQKLPCIFVERLVSECTFMIKHVYDPLEAMRQTGDRELGYKIVELLSDGRPQIVAFTDWMRVGYPNRDGSFTDDNPMARCFRREVRLAVLNPLDAKVGEMVCMIGMTTVSSSSNAPVHIEGRWFEIVHGTWVRTA